MIVGRRIFVGENGAVEDVWEFGRCSVAALVFVHDDGSPEGFFESFVAAVSVGDVLGGYDVLEVGEVVFPTVTSA